jgi:glucose-6-phosphate isomerase
MVSPCLTAPVGWGAEGTNGQHAFFQQLHQGPEPVPVDFIAPWRSDDGPQAVQDALLAHTLAQAEALLIGRSAESFMAEHRAKGMSEADAAILAAQRACPGNRPSTILSMERLTPTTLGAVLAFFEHRTFVEGVLWGVNSFDQWGVELGKVLAARVDAAMASGDTSEIHASTAYSLERWRAASQTNK